MDDDDLIVFTILLATVLGILSLIIEGVVFL